MEELSKEEQFLKLRKQWLQTFNPNFSLITSNMESLATLEIWKVWWMIDELKQLKLVLEVDACINQVLLLQQQGALQQLQKLELYYQTQAKAIYRAWTTIEESD